MGPYNVRARLVYTITTTMCENDCNKLAIDIINNFSIYAFMPYITTNKFNALQVVGN